MESVIFCTYISDHLRECYGANKLWRSCKYFHPDIPFVFFGDKEMEELMKPNPTYYKSRQWLVMGALCGLSLCEKFDLVVVFNADSVILDTLDEILDNDYEIASVRNHNDIGKTGPGLSNTILDIPVLKYCNVGIVASRNKEFWPFWNTQNILHIGNSLRDDNDVFNVIFHSGKYKGKILDDASTTNLYYGVSSMYGTHTYWEGWKELYLKNEKVYLGNKQVKVLHHAGGPSTEKLQDSLFSNEIAQHIHKITSVVGK